MVSLHRTPKSERTRARILEAAEDHFARRGFDGSRVEAIAKQSGVRRATLFYHFDDKSDLYACVLRQLFGPLLDRMRKVFATGIDSGLIERAISEYFDHLNDHPHLARIILREVADAQPGRPAPILRHAKGFADEIEALLAPLRSTGVDPVRLMLMVSGASVFFVSATHLLDAGVARNSGEELARNKAEVARLVRRQLGLEIPETPPPAFIKEPS